MALITAHFSICLRHIYISPPTFLASAMGKDDVQNGVFDKEVTIRLNVGNVAKLLLFALLFVGVFFLGRWSVDPEEVLATGFATGDLVYVAEDGTPLPAPEGEEVPLPKKEPKKSLISRLVDAFSSEEEEWPVGDEKTTEEAVTPAPSASATTPATNTAAPAQTPAPAASTPTAAVTANISTAPAEEQVITSYTRVAISLDHVRTDWKETWGKILQLDFTIKNNEGGTIKPAYIILSVEGYNEEAEKKKVPLKETSKNIKGGQTHLGAAVVPQGFNYNPITAGNLQDVQITITLHDSNDKQMAGYTKGYDLSKTG